ncbi:MAG: hypothetical protein H6970_09705 [Gammaproteobacteria bacterium]|nr:hypothetical protein [Gammaproteobacteria bacterium]
MLLNLARRANGHPAYFLQLGSISSTFQFQNTLGGSPATGVFNQARTRTSGGAISTTLTQGYALGFTASEQPTFSITPLSGNTFATAIFSPINSKIFFNLFQQGTAVDQLMRVMFQSIQFYYPKSGRAVVLNNIPDIERPEKFQEFLRLAGLARRLQVDQLLIATDGDTSFTLATIPGSEKALTALEHDGYYHIEGVTNSNVERDGHPTIAFKLRTFEGVLSALASEYQIFDELANTKPEFLESIPPSERQPILRFDWNGYPDRVTEPVTEVTYRGKVYSISDRDVDRPDTPWHESNIWNREVFILLTHLYTQISLDPKDLPVQQLIQVQ